MRALASSLAAALLVGCCLAGCSTYTDHTREAQRAVVSGNVEDAVLHLNRRMEVEEMDGLPANLEDDKVLFLLERATLLQALGNYESAARDMIHIDDRLEWVDFTGETQDNILRFVYTDDAGEYRAPPHERLLLNTMNMVNFLAMGDTEGARVEARRFDVMQNYYYDSDPEQVATNILGLGNYLAGVAFELAEQYDSSVRFYTDAYAYGVWPEADEQRLLDLILLTGYRGQGLGERRDTVGDLFERADQRERPNRQTFRERHRSGDTLFVIQTGMVPYRRAERIGMARAIDRSRRTRHSSVHFEADTEEKALLLASSGSFNWLNYARLTNEGLPGQRSVSLNTGETTLRLGNPVHLSGQIEESWDEIANTALAAGISRAVARNVVGAGSAKATEAIVSQSERMEGASRLIGALTGATIKASMAAADTPDTRSWISLPADIHLVRMQLEPGPRELEIGVNGRTEHRSVDIHPTRFQLYNFSRLR